MTPIVLQVMKSLMSYFWAVILEEKDEVLIVLDVLHTLHLLHGKEPFRVPKILTLVGGGFTTLGASVSFNVLLFLKKNI